MITTLISLIFFCAIAGVIVWGLQEIIKVIPLGEPFKTIIRILFIIIIVIIIVYIAQILLGLAGIHTQTFRL